MREDTRQPTFLRSLARARSVCKTSKTVIDHSPSLLATLNSFLNPRARAPATTYQAYIDQHEIHPLFESSFVPKISNLLHESKFLDQEKPLMRLFNKKERFTKSPPTFLFSSATGTGFADNSPLLEMYLCNPPPEAVRILTRATFRDPITLLDCVRETTVPSVIKLRGVKIGDVFEKAMSKAVTRQHILLEETATNYLWEMEVRVDSLWGAVGPDLGSHVESADTVSPGGELMWDCCDLAGCYLD
jgi:hypothetical protein